MDNKELKIYLSVFLNLKLDFGLKKLNQTKVMYISVVIPTYNRLSILEKCLLALENQELNNRQISNYEVIVVDDGSTDRTLAWLEEHKDRLPHVKVYQQQHQGGGCRKKLRG